MKQCQLTDCSIRLAMRKEATGQLVLWTLALTERAPSPPCELRTSWYVHMKSEKIMTSKTTFVEHLRFFGKYPAMGVTRYRWSVMA